jgi:hypothetical protein
MAPQWSTDEDRALLLALVQVMAPDGPSKNQMEAVIKAIDDRWTLGAASTTTKSSAPSTPPPSVSPLAKTQTHPRQSAAARPRSARLPLRRLLRLPLLLLFRGLPGPLPPPPGLPSKLLLRRLRPHRRRLPGTGRRRSRSCRELCFLT